MTSLRSNAQTILKKGTYYAGLILVADFGGFGLISLVLGFRVFHYFTLFTLAQAGLLFLIAGGIDVAGSSSFNMMLKRKTDDQGRWNIEVHRAAQSKAASFVASGLLLLLISFLLAYPLN